MRTLALLVLSLALPGSHSIPQLRPPEDRTVKQPAHKGGRWYFAKNGHAVYCFGPVRLIPIPEGGLEHVATFCQGERPMVPLQD